MVLVGNSPWIADLGTASLGYLERKLSTLVFLNCVCSLIIVLVTVLVKQLVGGSVVWLNVGNARPLVHELLCV
jgi:hypothetical protein